MAEYVQGRDVHYWHAAYLESTKNVQNLHRKIRDLEAQVGRQKRTIGALIEEKAQNDAEKPVDGPVVNEGTSTLEQRVNKLERNVETYGKVFDTVDVTLNVLIDRLKKLEQRGPVETKVNVNLSDMVIKGAAMLDLADAVNRSINKRGRSL